MKTPSSNVEIALGYCHTARRPARDVSRADRYHTVALATACVDVSPLAAPRSPVPFSNLACVPTPRSALGREAGGPHAHN